MCDSAVTPIASAGTCVSDRQPDHVDSVLPLAFKLAFAYANKGGTPELGEDLAQELALVLVRKARTFDPARGKATTWCTVVARSHLPRIAKRLRAGLPTRPLSEWEDPAFDPPEPGEWEERLERLDPADRELIAAVVIEGRTLTEVGRRTGCHRQTAWKRLHRALERLASVQAPG